MHILGTDRSGICTFLALCIIAAKANKQSKGEEGRASQQENFVWMWRRKPRWYPASLLLSLCCFSADAEDQDEDHDEGQDEDQDEDQDDKTRIKTKSKTTRRRSRQEKRTNKQTEDKAGSPYRHQHPHRHRSTPLMNTPSTSMPPPLSLLITGADRRREAVHHSRCVHLKNLLIRR